MDFGINLWNIHLKYECWINSKLYRYLSQRYCYKYNNLKSLKNDNLYVWHQITLLWDPISGLCCHEWVIVTNTQCNVCSWNPIVHTDRSSLVFIDAELFVAALTKHCQVYGDVNMKYGFIMDDLDLTSKCIYGTTNFNVHKIVMFFFKLA